MEQAARIGQEYETNVSVQQVLETISDTILQIVLFQVEAKENESELVNLNVKPLLASMKYLVDLARKKAEKWVGTGEEKNQKNMLRACATMAKATETIDSALDRLKKNAYDEKAKDELLWAARTVVQCTVTLLQLADNYDIRKMIQGAKDSQKEQDKLLALEDMGQLADIVRSYIFQVVNLAKMVEARAVYVPDPVLQKKFREANEVVSKLPEPLIEAQVKGKTTNDQQAFETAQDHAKKLKKAYKNIIKYAKLSSQEMFAGIDLDLNPLDDDDPYAKKMPATAQNLIELCRRLQNVAQANSPQKALQAAQDVQESAMEQLKLGKEAIAEETDPEKKNLMKQAAANLANALRNMLDNVKDYAKKPTEPKKHKVIDAVESLVNASDAMKEAIEMPDHFDKAAESTALALASLADAVRFAPEKEAIAAAKKAVAAIQDQVKAAQAAPIKRTPQQKKALQKAVEEQKPVLKGLLNATKAALANRDNPDNMKAQQALQTFDAALENAEAYSQKIENLTNPNKVAQMAFTTPAEKLQALVDHANRAMAKLANTKEPEEAKEQIKALSDAIGKEILLARANGHGTTGAKLQDALREVVKAVRSNVKGGNNPKTLEALDVALENLKDEQQNLVEVMLDPEQVVMHSTGNLDTHAAALLEALQNNDQRAAKQELNEVKRALLAQANAAKNAPAEGEQAERLKKLGAAQASLAQKLEQAVDKALKTNNITPVRMLLEEAAQNAKEIAGAVASDPEYGTIANCAKLANAIKRLEAAKNTGDESAAREALDEIMRKLKDDGLLCSMLSGRNPNKALKKTLLECGQNIADILSGMAGVTGDVLGFDPEALDNLIQRTKDVNAILLGATGSPEEKIEQIGQQINNLIDTLEFPVTEATQPALNAIVDGMEQQLLLADSVAKAHPERKDELDYVIEKTKRHLENLRPAIEEALTDPEDDEAQNRLENMLQNTKQLNNDIIDASQPPLWERVISNCKAIARDLPDLIKAVKTGNKQSGLSLVSGLSSRMEVQAQLVLRGANRVQNEKIKSQLLDAGSDQEVIAENINKLGTARINGTGDWSVTAKFNSTSNKARKVNEAILKLAKKLHSGEEEDEEELEQLDNQQSTASQLDLISLKVRKAARELQVDDTTKGQMFGCAKELGELLNDLSNAAASGDKSDMIKATKKIATTVQKVVKLSKLVDCSNTEDKDTIVSHAVNAKNFAVQLKILSAVKASISGTDKTAETQLISCAQQLADNVMASVKATDVAELKK